MTDQSSTPTAAADDPDERLYDAYLDAALAGRLESPDVFLARHPAAGELLRARLQALHAMLEGAPVPDVVADLEGASGDPVAEDVPYERLGEFRLLRLIDEGGMGAVYLAEQESLGRVVALKVIRPELHGSPTAAARFEREAQVIARLRHPNIVTAFAVGVDHGVHYLALEFVPGRSLDALLAAAAQDNTPLAPAQAVTWMAQIARALECAHEAGVIHRDVKPANIRITPDGRPLLLDFGIAHDVEALGLTRTGPLLGSPAYAAPEQVGRAGGVGPPTDVHGLGTTLYECLSGSAPHLGETLEETLHRVLERDAVPVRQLNASVSRDLETVLSHALEKDPARRYPTAAAFADDLEALLAFRPIAARRPGPLRRTWQWLRRHPAVAAGTLVALLALFAAIGLSIAGDRADRLQRQADARAAVTRARGALDRYRTSRERTAGLEKRVAELIEKQATDYLTPEQDTFLDQQEDAVDVARREREQAFYELLELLRQAEQLDPHVEGVRRTRAELYAEKWREMRAAGATGAERFYRDLVEGDDPTGEVLGAVEGFGRMLIDSDPPDARVYLFRYQELAELVAGGERRLVPSPFRSDDENEAERPRSKVLPGTWALQLVESAGELRSGDLITELAGTRIEEMGPAEARAVAGRGGARALVLSAGTLRQRTLPPGLVLRSTTQPLALDGESFRGTAPVDLKLPSGEYIAVLVAPGRELTRSWFPVRPSKEGMRRVALPLVGSTPRGFVRVPHEVKDVPYTYFLMEREVTVAEYLEYLNDPQTLAAIDAKTGPIRIPRGRPSEFHWPRAADGRFSIPPDWLPTWPIIGISQQDALAYAAYRTARRAAENPGGLPDHIFDLPTLTEWTVAAKAGETRTYVFGQRFRPKWVNSCYSKPQALPESVLSYPRDEAPTGAQDMCGSAFEWSVDVYDAGRGMVRVLGGAWGRADPEMFKVQSGMGLPPDATSGETGMRLVLRPRRAR